MTIRPFRIEDEAAVIELWTKCELTRPWNDPSKDIQRKLQVQPELFLVGEDEHGIIIASVMAGYEGHRGWLNYLAVHPAHQRRGHARTLLAEAERLLLERGCPKINLQVRSTNAAAAAFYHALGYDLDEVLSMGKRLVQDAPPVS
ncbi:ribosomal protein S18 acetylase RimI-like enzyme [Roseimicrobium gellanilyticum]|uniref:Ribosomal protein S18 acetylase RimI-like enzyme n=1 Tax=Roseimicrobium gellanilyticum TaxID=748857 RepID=A0A366HPJ0_9BACT|nr:GNAT family acetyltransferase [Roseimicrobium gellanilyticum]RBP44505.1 ribosomal protein S18 acetylase RimI-like enzyme [Roseimicrobium gellanilyticum]